MRLLASVRSANEVESALAGGADIIDAKEPAHGALGPVSAEVLTQILDRVPAHREVSVALGDCSDPASLSARIAGLPLGRRSSAVYLKLGFAGVGRTERIAELLQAAILAASLRPESGARIVAVAYADADVAGTFPPDLIWRVAAQAGIPGVLIDTYSKENGGLFDWIPPLALRDLVSAARDAGLLTAVAGSLGLAQLESVFSAGPDVVGFRGALCRGGRKGRLSRTRVSQLRRTLANLASGSVHLAPVYR
jgi:uncharacterized protein (UPF0264 family)